VGVRRKKEKKIYGGSETTPYIIEEKETHWPEEP